MQMPAAIVRMTMAGGFLSGVIMTFLSALLGFQPAQSGKMNVKPNLFVMSIQYTMQEANDLNNEGATLLYPRMLLGSCCTSEELAERISENSTFAPGEVLGLLRLLAHEAASAMADGRPVKLDGIGILTPGLFLREGKEREQAGGNTPRRNAQSLCVGRVHFRVEKSMLSEVNQRASFERSAKRMGLRISPYDAGTRLRMAKQEIAAKGFLTIGDYAALAKVSRHGAGLELKRWASDPASGITATGRGSHRVYVLAAG